MTPTPRTRVPWSHWDKVLFVVIGVVVILAVSIALRVRGLDVNPSVTVPTPTLPSPNAYDYFVAADNAHTEDKWASGDPFRDNSSAAMAAKEQSLSQNVRAFGLLHQGFQYPFQAPPSRSFYGPNFTNYQKLRSLARVLALEANVDAQKGDWNGSLAADMDDMQLGEEMPHGGSLIAMLVGSACQSIGRRQAWDAINHLDAAGARAAARRLEHIRADHVPFADTLQEEEWTTQASLLELMHGRDWPSNFVGINGGSIPAKFQQNVTATRIRLAGKRAIMANYTGYMDQSIVNARLPYAAHPAEPPAPSDPLNQTLLEYPLGDTRLREAETNTQNTLLLVMLALRAYKLEHGAYPATLSALAPGYLKSVPADPFALSGPLCYKLQGAKYLLYSVGPDGKDDGGQPIFDRTKPAPTIPTSRDPRYYIQKNSIGDIVAGVNVN